MNVTVASTVGRGAGDRAVPPGWRANPSAWAERLPIAVAGLVGGTGRWRAMPWTVIVFGVAVGPLGAAGRRLALAGVLGVG